MSMIPKEVSRELIKENNFKSTTEIMDAIKDMFKDIFQKVMEAELDTQLSYDRQERRKTASSSGGKVCSIRDEIYHFEDIKIGNASHNGRKNTGIIRLFCEVSQHSQPTGFKQRSLSVIFEHGKCVLFPPTRNNGQSKNQCCQTSMRTEMFLRRHPENGSARVCASDSE